MTCPTRICTLSSNLQMRKEERPTMLSPFYYVQQFRECASLLARFRGREIPHKHGGIHRIIFPAHRPLLNCLNQALFEPSHHHTFFLPDAAGPDSKRTADAQLSGHVTWRRQCGARTHSVCQNHIRKYTVSNYNQFIIGHWDTKGRKVGAY